VVFDYHTLLFGAMAILIGFQSINFAVFSKIFATSEGLLPEDLRLNRLYHYVTLEVGLATGALLILFGAGMWLFGLSYWRSHAFGPLDPDRTLRVVVPGFVSLTLGVQIVLSSFFLSVLGMRRR
jgi:nicotinamide riboside transporter PnuC